MEYANQLKINNYVWSQKVGFLKVRTGKDIDEIYKGKWDVKPIKIDNNLRCFGFEQTDVFRHNELSGYFLKLYENQPISGHIYGCTVHKELIDGSSIQLTDCFYLHQLQNLFVFLAKVEIKINES